MTRINKVGDIVIVPAFSLQMPRVPVSLTAQDVSNKLAVPYTEAGDSGHRTKGASSKLQWMAAGSPHTLPLPLGFPSRCSALTRPSSIRSNPVVWSGSFGLSCVFPGGEKISLCSLPQRHVPSEPVFLFQPSPRIFDPLHEGKLVLPISGITVLLVSFS